MAITFDGTALPSPGLVSPALVGDEVFEVTITGHATTYSSITTLNAKAGRVEKTVLMSGKTAVRTTGTKGSLVVDTTTYTNCVIDGGVQVEEVGGVPAGGWYYTVTFARDTV